MTDGAPVLPLDQGDEALAAALLERLFPVMRSLTGPGARETHDVLSSLAPFERIEVPSGTQVLDWTVPKEWIFREAYIVGPDGQRVVDAADHNLHVVNYSIPFRGTMSRQALDQHLHSLPEQPDAIPYVTSYYAPSWGFCLSQRQRDALPEGTYQVVVDSDLVEGSMTLSEALLPGESQQEVLFSSYTCHPSMANDELCAPIALALLCRRLAARPRRRLTYRFVLLPETIGSIAYLARRGDHLMDKLVAGYAVANIGRPLPLQVKRSRRGDSWADRVAEQVLTQRDPETLVIPFAPVGSDERQYCSPGFDLPVAALTRGEPTYPEYHSSLDDLDLVSAKTLAETVDDLVALCDCLELNRRYRNLKPRGEPQLGRYGLYPSKGSRNDRDQKVLAFAWLLNQSDGTQDLLAISKTSGLPMALLAEAAADCVGCGLLEEIESER